MDSTTNTMGIVPTMPITGDSGAFGNGGMWIFALLILLLIGNGGNGLFGGKSNAATQSDVVYTSAFNQLQDENTAIRADIQRTAYENMATTKDTAYSNLSELRDIQASIAAGFANQQTCCCNTLRAIDQVNYNGATNTAAIQKTIVEEAQKNRDLISTNRMADMQNQINQLQLAQAMNGVVRYPNGWTYNAGSSPFCPGCGGNI